jgi:hypothetical protein
VVDRTAGVTASFITELLRKAALLAAVEAPTELIVQDRHLDAALTELTDEGSRLTRALLGADPSAEPQPAAPGFAWRPRPPVAMPSVWSPRITGHP